MTVEQVVTGVPKPYVSCDRCLGYGVGLGPVNEATGKREHVPCQECEGTGAKIRAGDMLRRPKLT